jgi:hypothetical protein
MRLYLYIAAVVAILAALWGFGRHQHATGVAEGRAEIQAKFDAYVDQQKLAQADADRARAAEDIRQFRNVERSRENDLKIQQVRAVADAGARSELDRLRSALAAGDRPVEEGGVAEALARAHAAAQVARDISAECASRYEGVAREAGELAAQVIGLQGYVLAIQPPEP